jgi:hypothetical protein
MNYFKNILIVVLAVGLILSFSMNTTQIAVQECVKEPYEQNQMVGGCVMQKASGRWIRTCG